MSDISDTIRSIRQHMRTQSGIIGAEYIIDNLVRSRLPPGYPDRQKVEHLGREFAALMLEKAQVEHTPCVSFERSESHGGAEKTTIRVVAVHPDLWAEITTLLHDLESRL